MLTDVQQLKDIKDKKVRAFYEDQNNRLNDWAEVDALVKHLADDVLDSFDPDADGDGRREREGGIMLEGGNIWEFLPESVKKARQDSEKKARWAININVIANILLLIAKVCTFRESWQHYSNPSARSSRHSSRPLYLSSPLLSTRVSISSARSSSGPPTD